MEPAQQGGGISILLPAKYHAEFNGYGSCTVVFSQRSAAVIMQISKGLFPLLILLYV